MTPNQIQLVKTSWAKVVPIKATAGKMFYDKLFKIDPELKLLFDEDLSSQIEKLMSALNTVVTSLDRLESVIPNIEDLARRHVAYGVEEKDYDSVGQAFMWTLEQGLGKGFTPEVKDAWLGAYSALSGVMKSAARKTA